ncbi:MAG: lipase family protein [Desulfobulbaceae bacterium]|nr:lipase family protein [Desulfobulbaceae bacterium]
MRKFNHKAKSFSKINLSYLARCANLCYEPKEDVKKELEALGFNLIGDRFYFSDKNTDTQAFVVGDKNKIIVSFRGTEGKFKDWATDVNLVKTSWTNSHPVGEVHSGFYGALKSVWEDMFAEIMNLRTNNQSIWLTGHSLGAALATLAAATLQLQHSNITINGVYTFGQPRLGDHKFSKNYNAELKTITFRCVNNNDVVTRVPPQIFGYSHVGKLMYFDTEGNLHADNNLSWWAKFWDRLEGRYDDMLNLTPDGVGDHSMNIYQKLSKENL